MDSMSDLENMNFGSKSRLAETRTLFSRSNSSSTSGTKPLDTAGSSQTEELDRPSSSKMSSQNMSFDEPVLNGPSSGQPSTQNNSALAATLAAQQDDHEPTQAVSKTNTQVPGELPGAMETPAYKPPPRPLQGSTVTSRWKRRGRLGLAKPKRMDPGAQSDENTQGFENEPTTAMPFAANSFDSLEFMSSSSSALNKLSRSPPPLPLSSQTRPLSSIYTGTGFDAAANSQRNSYLSMDEPAGDADNTFQVSRPRSKNPSSMVSIGNNSYAGAGYFSRGAASQGMLNTDLMMSMANRSMDASDVSMTSNPKSRPQSPEPTSAGRTPGSGDTLGAVRPNNASGLNSSGKRTAESRAPGSTDSIDSVLQGNDSARRREMSPVPSNRQQLRPPLSPLLTSSTPQTSNPASQKNDLSGSPKPLRSSHNYPLRPGTGLEKQSSVYGDSSAMEVATRFQEYERRMNDQSPLHRSPRDRPRLLGSLVRSSESSVSTEGRKGEEVQQPIHSQHALSEPKQQQYHQARLHSGSSSARSAGERHHQPLSSLSHLQGRTEDEPQRPGYLSAGHASPKVQPQSFSARPLRSENNFEALRNSSPGLQPIANPSKQPVTTAEVRSDERNRLAVALPTVEDKAALQENYASAMMRANQIQQQKQQSYQSRQVRQTPTGHAQSQQYQHQVFDSQPSQIENEHKSAFQSQQSPSVESQNMSHHVQPQQIQQPRQVQQNQLLQHNQQQQQQALRNSGIDPKRTLVVNGRTYQKISITGRGGSSKVYKAMSTKHEIFAIKRVSFSRADVQAIEGYVNEIILLRKFEGNPCIIQLFDAEINKERGLLHMVMEFGETDLSNVLKRSGDRPLGMNVIRLYWEQMLRAVQTIHEERVVHADLKPANYLLVKGSLKLIDFGIAKAIGNDTTNIHRENQVGTVNYMSPEAIKETNTDSGRRLMKLGRASDIWSLGIILYQMCYGHTPFAQLALFKKLASIPDPKFVIPYPRYMAGCLQIGTERDPNADANPRYPDGSEKIAVPPDLLRVMKVCLQRDPEKRMTIPDLLIDPLLCPISLEHALPSAMSQMLTLLKRTPQVLDQWDVSEAQNEKVLGQLVRALGQQEQAK
ncbi:Dual-specificity kinase, spindle pole body (SPB) duplication and spindle checkpoint function [Coemansia sp. Benny D115]|nr:Dual-specificity kinase, spindle pole body (SPB) duplication and spindle checkpoint function [Coemansia sp. Benny D115]